MIRKIRAIVLLVAMVCVVFAGVAGNAQEGAGRGPASDLVDRSHLSDHRASSVPVADVSFLQRGRQFPESTRADASTDAIEFTSRTAHGSQQRAASASELVSLERYSLPYPQTIFGADDRVRLSPAYAPVVHILLRFENVVGQCSGTFIGPTVVLTSAHCLYDPTGLGWAEIAQVAAGRDGNVLPYGAEFATTFAVATEWINSVNAGSPDPTYDYGLIVLPSSAMANQTGWMTIGALTDASLLAPNFNPMTIGYPGDKPDGTQWAMSASGFLNVTASQLISHHDVSPGQSGSGMFRGEDGLLVGIVSFGNASFNAANRIRESVVNGIINYCDEAACAISSFIEQPTTPPATPIPNPSVDPIERTWSRTDKPVADQRVNRTWMWGPEAFTEESEGYADAPAGQRDVVYFDKSRMEINDPRKDPSDPWYVTNGLLVVELVTGNLQTGDNEHQPRWPAEVNVAGDANDATGPTYATFGGLRNATPAPSGSSITQRVNRSGSVWTDGALAGYGVTAGPYISETKHTIAEPFWAFMNSSGLIYENGSFSNDALFEPWFYATGFPITEAYWANVKVGGIYQDVLMQCFERRCLTYTPGNSDGWKVEAGNVGRHYYTWRYVDTGPVTPMPTATPTATATTTPSPTPTATATQPAPTPTSTQPGNGVPAEGAVVFQPDLSAFEPYTSADGKVRGYWDSATSSYVVEDSTVVGAEPSGLYTWWPATSEMSADYSVSMDVVTLTGDTSHDSMASLYYRLESGMQGVTEFATVDLTTSGWIGSFYVGQGTSATLAEFHLPANFKSGYGAVNQLKAVVKGDHAWIYLNGVLAHDLKLDPRNSQLANGFAFATLRTGNTVPITRFGFRNLVVREVQ